MTADITPEFTPEEVAEFLRPVADQLLLIRALTDQAGEEADARRLRMAKEGAPGQSWQAATADGEFAGEVRIDRGALTVRISDLSDFEAWVAQEHPGKMVTYPATSNSPTVDTGLREALAEACREYAEELAQAGPFSDRAVEVFLTELGLHGYTLTRLETQKSHTAPASEFTVQVLAAVKKNAEDAPPGKVTPIYKGKEVHGVSATRAPSVPKVEAVKDRAVLARFVRDRAADVAAIVNPPQAVEGG